MHEQVGSAILRNGEEMTITLVEAPAEEYAEPLAAFYRHKSDSVRRDLRQRLRGDYATDCLDRFFCGQVEGRIVSVMWYTLPRDTFDVGVFGHVYTRPHWRGKGAASALMPVLMADVTAGRGQALFCGVGDPSAQRIYGRHGFVPLDPRRAPVGRQGWFRPPLSGFTELEEEVFRPGQPVTARAAHMGDRARIDKILHATGPVQALGGSWGRVFLGTNWLDFVTMLQAREDGRGPLMVLETPGPHVVGYAFAFATGSSLEAGSKVLDLLVHPHYRNQARLLIDATCEAALAGGADAVRAYIPATNEEKAGLLEDSNFAEECRLAGYCRIGDQLSDLVVLRRG